MRDFLAMSWLLWGAVLPVFAGLALAPVFGAESWAGAVAGGLVALPLSLWGLRLAERIQPPPLPPPANVPAGAAPADDRPDWQTTVGKVLLCLLPVALGAFGLVTGTSVIVIPGGNQPGQPLMWSVSGPLGRVVAVGLVGIGLGGLAKVRATGKSPLASWALGLGLLLALGGSLIHGIETVARRFVQ